MMDAENYNKIRRILFSAIHNPQRGFSVAYEWMEKTYRSKLGPKCYVGLMAEMKFYEHYKRDFQLTVAGDMGEHADFSGSYDSKTTRFDVTTNLFFKEFKNYEPYLGEGINYKIVLYDEANFNIIDVLALAFKRCECGGYMVPFILLLDKNVNSEGDSLWSNDQTYMKICSNCCEFVELDRFTHHFLFSPNEYLDGIPEELDPEEVIHIKNKYCLENYKYFRRECKDDIMAIAENKYIITGKRGEGYWTFDYPFKNKAVADKFPEKIDCGKIR